MAKEQDQHSGKAKSVHSERAEPSRPGGYEGVRQPIPAAPQHPSDPRPSDEEIVASVLAALGTDGRVATEALAVGCAEGVVRLGGSVPLEFQRELAQALAEGCPGVLVCENRLTVEQPGPMSPK